MSKIIYYMGAGASYGSKEAREVLDKGTEAERLIVHEGLPVVNEITKCLLAFKDVVINAPIDTDGIYEFMNTYRTDGYSVNRARDELTKDIDELYVASKEHATIDTYAKKLYLTRRQNEFERLKNVLSAFFVWIQMESKVDQRYDTFLANVLGMNLYFPKELSVNHHCDRHLESWKFYCSTRFKSETKGNKRTRKDKKYLHYLHHVK